jgi:chromosome segregation ATPase
MNRKTDNLKATLNAIKGQIADASKELATIFGEIESKKEAIVLLEQEQQRLVDEKRQFDSYVADTTAKLSAFENELFERQISIDKEFADANKVLENIDADIKSKSKTLRDLSGAISDKDRELNSVLDAIKDASLETIKYEQLLQDKRDVEAEIKGLHEEQLKSIAQFDVDRKDMVANLASLKDKYMEIMRSIGDETKSSIERKEALVKQSKELDQKRRVIMTLAKRIENYHKQRNPNFKINVI